MSQHQEQFEEPTVFDFHGVPMTKFFTDSWDELQNFKARPDDVVLATYPKSGTTWVGYMLDCLYFGNMSSEHESNVPLQERVPFLELCKPSGPSGVDKVNQLPTTPRLIKTHLPVQFLPKSFWEQNVRIVNVVRNAKDTAVSFYHFHHITRTMPTPKDWSSFLQDFVDGKVVYGSWHDHVNGWWEKRRTYSRIHYIHYEDMIEDAGRELDRLCSFLGLSLSAEEKQRINASTTFSSMKQNKMLNVSPVKSTSGKLSLSLLRKGKVGDWKNHFTMAQDQMFEEDYKQKMKDSTLQFRTDV